MQNAFFGIKISRMYPDILTGEFTNATAGGHRNNTGLKRIRNFCDYFR